MIPVWKCYGHQWINTETEGSRQKKMKGKECKKKDNVNGNYRRVLENETANSDL